MPSTLAESFELLVQVEQLAPRLEAAGKALDQLAGLDEEKTWLAAARARIEAVRAEAHSKLLDRALRLPELESLKGERGKLLQGALADEVERLQAGIAYAGGVRSPLLEVLFLNLKIPALRKSSRTEVEKFCAEIERRLASSYAKRMFKTDPYATVMTNVRALEAAIATWRSVFIDPPIDGAAASELRDDLTAAGASVELALRQARLLAQAALLPTTELLDAAGVMTAKAKRRKDDDDAHPMLERDPPSPQQPTAGEQAEIDRLHAAG